jgi:hypothetical protein
MRIRILLFLLIGISFSATAQTDTTALARKTVSKKKITYYNTLLAGGLLGESGKGSGLTLSTTHGVRINRFSIGAGIGFDSYFDWKTVPVFGTVEFDFAKVRKNAFFVQINGGYADAARINREEWLMEYREYGGPMYSYLLGYKMKAEKFSLYLLAGYKFQEANFSYSQPPWSSFIGPAGYSVEEEINRLVVQLGFGLN